MKAEKVERWIVAKWISSYDGKKALADAIKKAAADCKSYQDAARVDPETLNKPMTI